MLNRFAKFLTYQLITRRMAVSEVDVYRTAQDVVRRYGAEAEKEAEAMAGQCAAAGDDDGARMWRQVARSARDILDVPRGPAN